MRVFAIAVLLLVLAACDITPDRIRQAGENIRTVIVEGRAVRCTAIPDVAIDKLPACSDLGER